LAFPESINMSDLWRRARPYHTERNCFLSYKVKFFPPYKTK